MSPDLPRTADDHAAAPGTVHDAIPPQHFGIGHDGGKVFLDIPGVGSFALEPSVARKFAKQLRRNADAVDRGRR